jgi:hypothetical protein
MTQLTMKSRKSKAWSWTFISVGSTIAALAISLVVFFIMFVTASESAHQATSSAEFPKTLLGIAMLTGFRHGPYFGVHPHLGLLIFPIFVFAVAIATSIPALKHFVSAIR